MQGTGDLVHVAAAKGHLDIVKYLIEECHVDPTCVQQVCMHIIHMQKYILYVLCHSYIHSHIDLGILVLTKQLF